MIEIQMTPVMSSNVVAIGYDAESKTLQVEFNSGTTYQYFDVQVEVFGAFERAESQGRFFNQFIKNRYAFERVA